MIAHDLRNPLTAIMSQIELLDAMISRPNTAAGQTARAECQDRRHRRPHVVFDHPHARSGTPGHEGPPP